MVKKQQKAIVESEEPIIQYNNKSQLDWEEHFTTEELTKEYAEQYDKADWKERRFLEDVDVTRAPITRTVTKVVRTRDNMGKEWFYWFENWEGLDRISNPLPKVVDHIEGVYDKLKTKNMLNDKGKLIGEQPAGVTRTFYIPWSKKTFDEVIVNANRDKDAIIYLVKIMDTFRCQDYSHDQFANLSFLELSALGQQKGGPRMTPYHAA